MYMISRPGTSRWDPLDWLHPDWCLIDPCSINPFAHKYFYVARGPIYAIKYARASQACIGYWQETRLKWKLGPYITELRFIQPDKRILTYMHVHQVK